MFIYKITNIINNMCYIGFDTGKEDKMNRWKTHIFCAETGKSPGHRSKIFNAMKKYGVKNFKCEIIDRANTFKELCEKEIYWISHFNSCIDGYNILKGGQGFTPLSELSIIDRKQRLKLYKTQTSKNNKEWWATASEEEKRKRLDKFHNGYSSERRSKNVKSDWDKMSVRERKKKTRGIRKYWASLTKEEKKIRCTTHHNGNPRKYIVTNPEGKMFEIFGLKRFCIDHNLNQYKMTRVLRGNIDNYEGWKICNQT